MSYLDMTKWVMQKYGIEVSEQGNTLIVPEGAYQDYELTVPADHSSASYWAGMAAMSEHSEFELAGLSLEDPQGDKIIFELIGKLLDITSSEKGILLKNAGNDPDLSSCDLSSTPDLFPTLAFVVAGLGAEARMTGLQSLPHKETDRLTAVRTELAKLNVVVTIDDDHTVSIAKPTGGPTRDVVFKSYDDHRMVMSAAMLACVLDQVDIEDPEVVDKSYPTFWKDMVRAGFRIEVIG